MDVAGLRPGCGRASAIFPLPGDTGRPAAHMRKIGGELQVCTVVVAGMAGASAPRDRGWGSGPAPGRKKDGLPASGG